MELQGQESKDLLQAQAHVYKHMTGYSSILCLRCAHELCIPEIINNHGRPITLSELVSGIPVHPTKSGFIKRIMRVLVHHRFFDSTRGGKNKEETYTLTPSSSLLLKDKVPSLSPFIELMFNPILVASCTHDLTNWLQEDTTITPFESIYGRNLLDYIKKNSDFGAVVDNAMDSDSSMLNLAVKDLKKLFEGVTSLVEVGGGRGAFCKIILDAFPHLQCTVLDLPHVVADLSDTTNLKFVGGDMFKAIPPADAILLKLMLHAWTDDECVSILKKCRESIQGSCGKKVIIIDIVLNENKDVTELTEAKLNYDIMTMILTNGEERNERDWAKLIRDAGFSRYEITATVGIRSVIQVFP